MSGAPLARTPIALVQAVDAEPGSGLRARQQHFSASALNAYVECARKWYYRYLCDAVQDPGSSASFYGTAFHAALEDFHAEFTRPTAAHEEAMRTRIREYVTWAFERFRADFGTAVEFTLQLRRAQRTAQRYVGWLVARFQRSPFTVIGRELATELDVEGFAFIGFIDRLDRNEKNDSISIIDYKTGSIANSAAEYRDKVKKFKDFQLPFYYWAREAKGDRVSTLALIPIKDATLDVKPIELEVVPVPTDEPRKYNDAPYGTISIVDLERSRERMAAICRELTGETITHFPVTTDPSACVYCAYATACNDRPPAPEERFGR